MPINSSLGEATFLIDPSGGSNFEVMRDSNLQPLKFARAYTSTAGTTDMAAFVYAKAGSTTVETVYIDYVACFQKR